MDKVIGSMLSMQGATLFLLTCGYYFGRKKILDDSTSRNLTALMLRLILPCNIFLSFLSNSGRDELEQYVEILLIAVVSQAMLSGLSRSLFRKAEENKKACLQYGLLCSNATFIGLSVIEAVYGSAGVACAAIAILPMRIVMWTNGYFLFYQRGNGSEEKGQIWKKALLNPCMAAVAAGILTMLVNIQLPAFLCRGFSYISQCTSGMAMLIIGSILSRIHLKEVYKKICFYIVYGDFF